MHYRDLTVGGEMNVQFDTGECTAVERMIDYRLKSRKGIFGESSGVAAVRDEFHGCRSVVSGGNDRVYLIATPLPQQSSMQTAPRFTGRVISCR